MQKNSSLIRLMDLDKQVKVIIADTTQVVEEARRRHQTSATASAALGRVITAALFLGSELKEDQELVTIRIVGDGMAGPIIATANGNGQVRGLVSNPQADLPSRYPGKLA
ncbi:Hsp33 family molecular chaperone HslO [Syntrophomonas palmitatica]|uniref:Hsp33 family molecular chaperone HslO n=1 Tax=Syntrophomonas palmitatica TaxID=402877 RepID=UPI0009FB2226|nr:Hsp33 family molecular chaperone HslO [Syntrophomonas palmitatica]